MILRGHEDLQPKKVIGFDMGFALVQCGDDVKRYALLVGAGGHVTARPVEENPHAIDQLPVGGDKELRARRFHGVDQL